MERSEKQARRLQLSIEFVTSFLARLTDSSLLGVDVTGRDVVRVAAMPKTAFYQAEGLAFISRRKKGCFVSLGSERVVLIWKKVLPDGTLVWSGPIFLKGRSLGCGFTLGFLDMRICLAILNTKGMGSVLRPHHRSSVAASFMVDMNGSKIRKLHTSSADEVSQVTTDAHGGMQAKYYLLEACIVDLSANGSSFGPDKQLNEAVYGEGVDVQAVLDCQVPPPPEFQPVYDLLNEYVNAVKRDHRSLTLKQDRSNGMRVSEAAADAVAEVGAAAAAAANGGGGKSGAVPVPAGVQRNSFRRSTSGASSGSLAAPGSRPGSGLATAAMAVPSNGMEGNSPSTVGGSANSRRQLSDIFASSPALSSPPLSL